MNPYSPTHQLDIVHEREYFSKGMALLAVPFSLYLKSRKGAAKMQISVIRRNMTREQIEEIAKQTAEHFLFCFSQDNLDVAEIANMMKRLCDAHKELAIHLGLLRYCKLFRRDSPGRYAPLP